MHSRGVWLFCKYCLVRESAHAAATATAPAVTAASASAIVADGNERAIARVKSNDDAGMKIIEARRVMLLIYKISTHFRYVWPVSWHTYPL